MSTLHPTLRAFIRGDDGAQVIEYALIIAVVSIALFVALSGLTGLPIGDLITRINNCLAGSCS